jgi:hypothetical protein
VEKRNIYLIEILSNFLYVNNKIIEGAVDITSVGIQISVTQNICEKKKGIFICDLTEILLKVMLNTINQSKPISSKKNYADSLGGGALSFTHVLMVVCPSVHHTFGVHSMT